MCMHAQSCLNLCNSMDCSLPGSSPWNFPGKNTGASSPFLLQGIFSTQWLNPCLLCLLHWHTDRFFIYRSVSRVHGKGIGTHPIPVLLPGKSHGWRSLVGCSPWGCWVRYDWAISLSVFTFMPWRRKWQPTPVFLPGESQEWGSLVGWWIWGRTESDTTEVA